jgi:hypothetical protein
MRQPAAWLSPAGAPTPPSRALCGLDMIGPQTGSLSSSVGDMSSPSLAAHCEAYFEGRAARRCDESGSRATARCSIGRCWTTVSMSLRYSPLPLVCVRQPPRWAGEVALHGVQQRQLPRAQTGGRVDVPPSQRAALRLPGRHSQPPHRAELPPLAVRGERRFGGITVENRHSHILI